MATASPAYKIEQGVPLPLKGTSRHGDGLGHALRAMAVGDSILVTDKPRSTLSTIMVYAGSRSGFQFTSRKETDGVRIWRVK